MNTPDNVGEDTADGALKPFIVTVLLVEGQWH
jgi:hypothetical protein